MSVPARRVGVPGIMGGTSQTTIGLTIGIKFKVSDTEEKDVPITAELNLVEAGAAGLSFGLAEGEFVTLGKLSDFYASARTQFEFLPDLNFASMPEPVPLITGAIVTVNAFRINTESGMLLLDVTFKLDPAYEFPLFPDLKLDYLALKVDRNQAPDPVPPLAYRPYS